ncbi:MAG: T9SS type A sorting domain-containing protein [Flavobacteriaceae bacterium]
MKIRLLSLFFILLSASTVLAQSADENAFEKKQELVVFPNPAENTVHILGLGNSSRAGIFITDTYGNTVMQLRWEIKNNSLSIPIPNLASGIYVVTINSPEQKVQTKFYKK